MTSAIQIKLLLSLNCSSLIPPPNPSELLTNHCSPFLTPKAQQQQKQWWSILSYCGIVCSKNLIFPFQWYLYTHLKTSLFSLASNCHIKDRPDHTLAFICLYFISCLCCDCVNVSHTFISLLTSSYSCLCFCSISPVFIFDHLCVSVWL